LSKEKPSVTETIPNFQATFAPQGTGTGTSQVRNKNKLPVWLPVLNLYKLTVTSSKNSLYKSPGNQIIFLGI
jgi:hypothetical protein